MQSATNDQGLRTRPSPFKAHSSSSREVDRVAETPRTARAASATMHGSTPMPPHHAAAGSHHHAASSSIAHPASSAAAAPMSAAASLRAFSSFLASPAYASSEHEVRREGTVDFSRRSGHGGTAGGFAARSARKKHAAHATATASTAAAIGSDPSFPQPHFDFADAEEEEERSKGDFAIVLRLERKIFSRRAVTFATETQQHTPEESVNGSSGMHGSLPSSSARRSAQSTTNTLQQSKRLRTLCNRLSHAGLRWVQERQIVNGCALLRVYAHRDTLEHAAFRMRLKMPLKPTQDHIPAAMSLPIIPQGVGAAATAAASSTAAAPAPAPASEFYTYVPFDPSIRDAFLGTQDSGGCLFRSSERQILIDYILRSPLEHFGAGLGEQHTNELDYAVKKEAQRKERRRRQREKEQEQREQKAAAAAAGASGSAPLQAPAQASPALFEDSELDSSDDEESPASKAAAQIVGGGGGGAASASSGSDVVPKIEQFISARFPLHSSRLEALDSWMSYWQLRKRMGRGAWLSGLFVQPLDQIQAYFGQEVGFFYAFMDFYIRSLVVPTIIGGVLFLTQLSTAAIDSPLLPLFSIFFAIWSSVMIEVWKRRESSLSWGWGSFDYEGDDEIARPEFRGITRWNETTQEEERVYPLHKRLAKIVSATALWILVLVGVGWALVVVFRLWDSVVNRMRQLHVGSGHFSLELIFVPALWGFLIPLLDILFSSLARALTNWENWALESTYAGALTAKVFSFRFTNAFLVLYYYIFSDEGSMVRLTTSVASFMIAGQLLRFVLGIGAPYLAQHWRGWRTRKNAEKSRNALIKATQSVHGAGKGLGAAGSAAALAVAAAAAARHAVTTDDELGLGSIGDSIELSQAWLESTYPDYDHFEEYANMAIQFGYVCFFSVCFPFAPLCALVNNLIMVRLGAYKLCRLTRRPLARKSGGMGIWLHVLQLMSLIAVLTNCALIAVTSTQLRSLFPSVTETTKILVIFAFEHLVILIKIGIALAIPGQTRAVRMQRRKEKLALTQANTQLMELRRKEIVQRAHQAGDLASIDQLYAVTI